MLEHAKLRFLSYSNLVVNVDIDELILSKENKTLSEHVNESTSGAIIFSGVWIQNIREKEQTVPKYSDFKYIDIRKGKPAKKWVLDPSRCDKEIQWNLHSFSKEFAPDEVDNVELKHFTGITPNWRNIEFRKEKKFNPEFNFIDKELVKTFEKVFFD
ncbi:glycosyltransferase family 92 protein [Methanobrevibacter filiformis]|uniref:Glycosyl transferase family 2 n=1 Tax=Methanobrevibacter filiformis TaxID=55758 RepID=A0A166A5E4_9EURY|nr:glycosyltransferase family 92 protein [Methanobrevibacter filiformis]KZX11596.1 hypothetical protein MBFIL_14100 [Methanobrevibacter filiformis]